MSKLSEQTSRKRRGLSLSSEIGNEKNLKEHFTTVQSSFIREPKPSSISFVDKRSERPIFHKSVSIPKKITFKYMNKPEISQQSTIKPYKSIQQNNLKLQPIRYLIGPKSSRIKQQTYQLLNSVNNFSNQLVIKTQAQNFNNIKVLQSSYVSPYRNLITPHKFEQLSARTLNNHQVLQNFLPINSQLSNIKQFKMEEQICQNKQNLIKKQIVNKNQNQQILSSPRLDSNPKQFLNEQNLDMVQIKNKNIIQQIQKMKQQSEINCILKEKDSNYQNIFSQKVKLQQNLSQKKTKGRANHLRIKQVQRRLQQIIMICDNSLY